MRWIRVVAPSIAGAALVATTPAGAQPAAEGAQPAAEQPQSTTTEPVTTTRPAPAPHVPGSPQLISVSYVTIVVSDPDAAHEAIAKLVRKAGGPPPGRAGNQVELRVPRTRVPSLLGELRQLGTRLERRTEVREVSGELADLASRIASAVATRERLEDLRASGRSVDDALLIERQLGQLDAQLADLRLEHAELQRQVDLATVHVTLTPEHRAAPEQIPQVVLPVIWLKQTGLGTLQDPPEKERREGEIIDSMLDGGVQAEVMVVDGLPDQDDTAWAAGGALRLRGTGGWPIGFAVGADIGLAGGTGFAYDLDFLLGLSGSASRWLSFGLLSGAAGRSFSGGRVPAAWEIPAELLVNVQFGEAGRLLLQARPQWIGPRIEARQDGSSVGFADELILRGTVALAPLVGNYDMNDGVLRLGIAYHELRDTQMWTFVLGWGAGDVDTM